MIRQQAFRRETAQRRGIRSRCDAVLGISWQRHGRMSWKRRACAFPSAATDRGYRFRGV